MEGYCLRTHLIEKPSVYLYYKGMEDNDAIPNVLNVIVAFTSAEAFVFDEDVAMTLCQQLNEDREILQSNGYAEWRASNLECANNAHYFLYQTRLL